jgi:hypothetical protein
MTGPHLSLSGLAVMPASSCLLAEADGESSLSNRKDHQFGLPGNWCLGTHATIGLVRLEPKPTREAIGKAYQRHDTHLVGDPSDRKSSQPPYLRRQLRRVHCWGLRRLGVMEVREQLLGMFLKGHFRDGCWRLAAAAALAW